ncbi:hypothetical protein HYU19_02260 [Candidatus Woesearchaeota archaeon]|nr:hypothetical protein [Candidatus Woesearchaeota archaeon]
MARGISIKDIETDLFDDRDFYGGDGVWEDAVDSDKMTPMEAAFMKGWDDAG